MASGDMVLRGQYMIDLWYLDIRRQAHAIVHLCYSI
jgi:hypothetical protein